MVNRLKKFFAGTYLGLMLVFLYAPILILIVYSFNLSKTLGNWTGFTFNWYAELFRTPEITDALVVTLSVAAISSIVATVLGTYAAIGLHAMKRNDRLLLREYFAAANGQPRPRHRHFADAAVPLRRPSRTGIRAC